MNKHLAELQKTLQETKNAIVACEAKNEKMNGMEAIEAAGRENYYMKRDDEVVFIFLKEENGELLLLE
jgi:cell division protein FtsB